MMRFVPGILVLVIHAVITTIMISGALPPPKQVTLPPDKLVPPPRLWSFKTEAVDEMVQQLKAEREKLETERKNMVAIQARVTAEKGELETVRNEIQTLKEELSKQVVAIEENEIKNLKTLAQTYTTMAPGAIVAILREMDDNQAVKILTLMKADRVGAVLGEWVKAADRSGEETMAKRAAKISDKLRLMKPIKKST